MAIYSTYTVYVPYALGYLPTAPKPTGLVQDTQPLCEYTAGVHTHAYYLRMHLLPRAYTVARDSEVAPAAPSEMVSSCCSMS